jgi:hypothetical protein
VGCPSHRPICPVMMLAHRALNTGCAARPEGRKFNPPNAPPRLHGAGLARGRACRLPSLGGESIYCYMDNKNSFGRWASPRIYIAPATQPTRTPPPPSPIPDGQRLRHDTPACWASCVSMSRSFSGGAAGEPRRNDVLETASSS